MNAKKKRNKNRRRARKLAEQAWEAADGDNFDLAVKIIRRAVDQDPANPVIWNDQGLLLRNLNELEKAAESFQAAISLAADFADAYANLAQIRVAQGEVRQAVILQGEAVRHAPKLERHKKSLAAYQALQGQNPDRPSLLETSRKAPDGDPLAERSLRTDFASLACRIDNLNWSEIETKLTRDGYVRVAELLPPELCETLRSMFDNDRLFSKTVTMNKSRFGKGVYRYFCPPIPRLVDAIRQFVYPPAALIANEWQSLLNDQQRYPANWADFRDQCAEAGQTTPTPLLLRYEAGGFNAPHQDIRGEIYFPLQLLIVLSPRAEFGAGGNDGFTGGNFLFCDEPQRKKSDRRTVPAGLGDAVLFCTRARLVKVGGVYGLKPVKHGVELITSGTRYAIGIPFHEYE